jgi:hypothetical protein
VDHRQAFLTLIEDYFVVHGFDVSVFGNSDQVTL